MPHPAQPQPQGKKFCHKVIMAKTAVGQRRKERVVDISLGVAFDILAAYHLDKVKKKHKKWYAARGCRCFQRWVLCPMKVQR